MMSPTVYTVTSDKVTVFPTCAEKHSKKGEYDGMVKERKVTDVHFLLAIGCMWIAMSVVGGIAVSKGDIFRLTAPMDDNGFLCGSSPGLESKPNFYTITAAGSDLMIFGTLNNLDLIFVTIVLTTSIFLRKTGSGVCVDNCPTDSKDLTSTNSKDYICLDWVGGYFRFVTSSILQRLHVMMIWIPV